MSSTKKMEENLFLEKRERVLKEWKADSNLEFSEVLKFYNYLPKNKIFSNKIRKNNQTKNIGIQVTFGTTLIEEELKVLKNLSENNNVDFLSVVVDSFTRENKFENSEKAIVESEKLNKSVLNGFPIVAYGIEKTRKLINELDVPLQLKHGSTNPKLLSEIAIASGISSIEGGGISHNISYSKSVSIEESIENWKYVDRLIGMYEENGVSIHREPYAILTGTLVPPAISNLIQIIECLLAAEQGVKNISLSCPQYGNLIQDIASLKALKEEAEYYCREFGYDDISLSTSFHQWVGGFPNDSMKSCGLISYATMSAVLSGADRIYVKNPEDLTSNYLNISLNNSIELTKAILKTLACQEINDFIEINLEKELIQKEVRQIMKKVLEFGKGDISRGVVEAFKQGVIDVPFSPSKYNLGRMMPARDINGMIRYLDIGNLPFDNDIKDFHMGKLKVRALFEERDINFQMTVDDIFAISKGELIGNKKNKN